MQKTSINPAILQELLESTPNAGVKGQAQYLTPTDWARSLSQALPRFRPVIVDLNCGNGQLLAGAERGSTIHLLGCDIDPEAGVAPASLIRITADVCKLYPLLKAAQFEADCFALNPPWDHHWRRDQLAGLAESDLATVRAAFAAHDGRTGHDTIDSTVATLCMALDRCSVYGEGLVIANEATMQRLIFADKAPHAALALHVWAHLVIPGNICCPDSVLRTPHSEFQTAVLYFARSHDAGPIPPPAMLNPSTTHTAADADVACRALHQHRLTLRQGAEIRSYGYDSSRQLNQWRAVAGEWERLHPGQSTKSETLYNLWLRPDGVIATNLSLFDQATERVDKGQAEALFALNGKQPLQLVMLRESRRALVRAVQGITPWRVDPALNRAVDEALVKYEAVRAPLYPLSDIQRLGYLDEHDFITCKHDLTSKDGSASYRADQTYPLRSTTVAVQRKGEKANLTGGTDSCEWNGQELAFFIKDAGGVERVFMEGRLRSKDVRISLLRPGEKPGRQNERHGLQTCGIDFTLHELVNHFEIPDVPDVARVNPAGYQRNLDLLKEIEDLCV